jgi:hypothetical protein
MFELLGDFEEAAIVLPLVLKVKTMFIHYLELVPLKQEQEVSF